MLNNHGDTTQHCINPTLTLKFGTAFNNFRTTPYTLSICHLPCRSIVSYYFTKSIINQNTYFLFAKYFRQIYGFDYIYIYI